MSHNGQQAPVEAGRVESKWPRSVRLSQLYSDPLRARVFSECVDRELSPRDFHREFGVAALPRIVQAFELLGHYEWLERVDAAERRDDLEDDPADYAYRVRGRPVVDEEVWQELPDSTRALIASRVIEGLTLRLKMAMESGTIFGRPDHLLLWDVIELDRQGWATVLSRLEAVFCSLSEEQDAARARMAESGERPTSMTVGLLAFESRRAAREEAVAPPRSGASG